MKTKIDFEYLTVRLANVLKRMNILYEEDVLYIIIPSIGSRVSTYNGGYNITTKVRQEFLEYFTEMRFKHL